MYDLCLHSFLCGLYMTFMIYLLLYCVRVTSLKLSAYVLVYISLCYVIVILFLSILHTSFDDTPSVLNRGYAPLMIFMFSVFPCNML